MAGEIIYTFEQIKVMTIELAKKIEADGKPNQLIGILWGAACITQILKELWKIRSGAMAMNSYKGDSRQRCNDDDVFFDRTLLLNSAGNGEDAVIVDDLPETGKTLKTTKAWLEHEHGYKYKRIRTATLFFKEGSLFKPDYYVEHIKPDAEGNLPWIVLPWEKFD